MPTTAPRIPARVKNQLNDTLADLDRAIAYIQQPNTAIARRSTNGGTGGVLTFSRPVLSEAAAANLLDAEQRTLNGGNYTLDEMNKDYGSEIVGLYNARRKLALLLGREPDPALDRR